MIKPKPEKAAFRETLARRVLAAGAAAAPVADAAQEAVQAVVTAAVRPMFEPRTYQLPIWSDHTTPLLLVEMGRQLGKSETTSGWAVDQLIIDLKLLAEGKWEHEFAPLVTVLSNSKANGLEVAMKAAAHGRRYMAAQAEIDGVEADIPDAVEIAKIKFDEMRFEVRITYKGRVGRILVLAANERTARGFSGHLILDEFAFHQNAAGIWEAAEPIVSSREYFKCRILSTHNGKRSLFYQMCRSGDYAVWSVKRSEAWAMGQGQASAWLAFVQRWKELKPDLCDLWLQQQSADVVRWIFAGDDTVPHPAPRKGDEIRIKSLKRSKGGMRFITPAEAEAEATDGRAYRQNYENDPQGDAGALLGMPVICNAERDFGWQVCDGEWDAATLTRLASLPANAELYVGQDVGRKHDLSSVAVVHKAGQVRRMVALLTMRGVTLPEQRRQMQALVKACAGRIKRVAIDYTGIGVGIAEELEERYRGLVLKVNFASTVPMDEKLASREGRKAATMRITEKMALHLQDLFTDGHIEIVQHADLRSDLNKPSRVAKGNMVSIAAEADGGDHADRFWSVALACHGIVEGGRSGGFTTETAAEMLSANGGLYRGDDSALHWHATAEALARATTARTPGGAHITLPGPHTPQKHALKFLKRANRAADALRHCAAAAKNALSALFQPSFSRLSHAV